MSVGSGGQGGPRGPLGFSYMVQIIVDKGLIVLFFSPFFAIFWSFFRWPFPPGNFSADALTGHLSVLCKKGLLNINEQISKVASIIYVLALTCWVHL